VRYPSMTKKVESRLEKKYNHRKDNMTTEQGKQVTEWLESLSHRKVCVLACQHKLLSWANRTTNQLVLELEKIPAVQEVALEMRNIK